MLDYIPHWDKLMMIWFAEWEVPEDTKCLLTQVSLFNVSWPIFSNLSKYLLEG